MSVDFAGDLGLVITEGVRLIMAHMNALIMCRSKLKLTNYLLLSAVKSPINKNKAF